MKKTLFLFIYSIGCALSVQMLSGCAEKNEPSMVSTEQIPVSKSVFGETTEEKLDDLLMEYVDDMKSALAEPDDKKAAVKIHQMKEQYNTRFNELQAELETWQNSLSEEEMKAFEQRMENKPYFKDLLATSLSAMGRITKSPELRKAFEELSSDMTFINEDLSPQEATGEEYPEDIVEEETDKK